LKFLITILLNALSLFIGAYLIPGIGIHNIKAGIIAGFVLSIANIIVKPILTILSLPITILTLGLFLLFINALVLLLVAWLVPGFVILTFNAAFLLGILLLVLNLFYSALSLR
jgi:putative membrane protein